MNAKKLNRLSARAQRLLRELESLLVLGNMMTHSTRRDVESQREDLIKRPTVKRLQHHVSDTEKRIAEIRHLLGVKVPNSNLVEFLEIVEAAPEGKTTLVPKHVIQNLFAHPEHTFERFNDFPAHVRIMVYHTKPPRHGDPTTVDWRSIEADLFEDLCALFNLAKEKCSKVNVAFDPLRARKTGNALLRATASTAFYFVEAYLNGLAYDRYIALGGKLAEDTKKKLTEWDSKLNRPYHLSLRDKLLQYPRIILGTQHPPLQESNCPELAFICGRAKLLRDSIVHASPHPDRESLKPVKEMALLNPDFEEVERVVDNAIALVRKVESAARGNDKGLFWMRERGTDGLFPLEVFY